MVGIPMMVQELRVSQFSDFLGTLRARELGSLWEPNSATLHFNYILSPRVMQPGSQGAREPESQRAREQGEPGSQKARKPESHAWTRGFRDTAFQRRFVAKDDARQPGSQRARDPWN
jgi:hypothetical protein